MANVASLSQDPEEAERHDAWVRDFTGDLPTGDGAAYVNFVGDEGEARVRAAYPGSTWERLRAVKRRYDPTNLFHLNQNVPPADEDA